MGAIYKMGVIGSGMMAHRRCKALLETNRVELVGVASKTKKNAEALAEKYNCRFSTIDYRELLSAQPDFLLVELPHSIQSEVVRWAIGEELHLLIGSCIAFSEDELHEIKRASTEKNLIIEGGFEARYKEVWKRSKQFIQSGDLGQITAIQSIACWSANVDSWYYSQKQSGGMPVTHMTYAFLNPLSWIFGPPLSVHAIANRIGEKKEGMVNEVSCVASLVYDNNIICSMLASYVNQTDAPTWKVVVLGTKGCLEIFPSEFGAGSLVLYRMNEIPLKVNFDGAPDAFLLQSEAFIDGLDGTVNGLQNSVIAGEGDVSTAAAIVKSIIEEKKITINQTNVFSYESES